MADLNKTYSEFMRMVRSCAMQLYDVAKELRGSEKNPNTYLADEMADTAGRLLHTYLDGAAVEPWFDATCARQAANILWLARERGYGVTDPSELVASAQAVADARVTEIEEPEPEWVDVYPDYPPLCERGCDTEGESSSDTEEDAGASCPSRKEV